MKKILVAVVALVMTSAFAHDGEHKHMITFDGLESDTVTDRSFDISFNNSEVGSTENNSSNVALNYTFAINGAWMVGGRYQNNGTQTTTGLHGFYNLDGRTHDTCYVGLHYMMTDVKASEDEMTTIALEYGHRFSLGMWKGLHLQFSPSVAYQMSTTEFNAGGDDQEDSAIAWNWIKFDLLF